MTALWKVVPTLAVIALLTLLYAEHQRGSYYEARSAAMADSLTKRREITAKADTVYRVDTLRYAVQRIQWDTARVTDTVIVDSVVYVNRDVADSTMALCDSALASCGSLVLGLRSELALTRDMLDLSRQALASQKRKGLWEKLGTGLVGFGAGSLACRF